MIEKVILPIVPAPEDEILSNFLDGGYTIIHTGNLVGGDGRPYISFVLYKKEKEYKKTFPEWNL